MIENNKQKIRKLKVYSGSQGKNYKQVPRIILQGEWLQNIGFNISDNVTVTMEEGKIIVEKENT